MKYQTNFQVGTYNEREILKEWNNYVLCIFEQEGLKLESPKSVLSIENTNILAHKRSFHSWVILDRRTGKKIMIEKISFLHISEIIKHNEQNLSNIKIYLYIKCNNENLK